MAGPGVIRPTTIAIIFSKRDTCVRSKNHTHKGAMSLQQIHFLTTLLMGSIEGT